jgi:hypothetical protein
MSKRKKKWKNSFKNNGKMYKGIRNIILGEKLVFRRDM